MLDTERNASGHLGDDNWVQWHFSLLLCQAHNHL